MGRSTKLTSDVQKRICDGIELGATYEDAANYGGITYTCFNNWMHRGQDAKSGPYLAFFEAVKSAEGKAVIKWLAKIEKAASDGEWQAAAWKLERRYPQGYGRKDRHELTGKEGGPIEHGIDDDAARRIADLIACGIKAGASGSSED